MLLRAWVAQELLEELDRARRPGESREDLVAAVLESWLQGRPED